MCGEAVALRESLWVGLPRTRLRRFASMAPEDGRLMHVRVVAYLSERRSLISTPLFLRVSA